MGPPFVPLAIFTLLFTVPFAFSRSTCSAPRSVLPVSSRLAPTARSVTPSPSRSPSDATEAPKLSPSASVGLPLVPLPIFTLLFTVPFAFSRSTCTAPRYVPPVSSRTAPTARSVTPSPSKSPSDATELPNESESVSVGPPFVPLAIFTLLATVPFAFSNSTCTAPRFVPPVSSPVDPTARSVTPSLFKSPSNTTEAPKLSPFTSVGPPFMPLAIFTLLFTVPFAFSSSTYTAPRFVPPVSSRGAPTARSGTPSPSRSPSDATELPKKSPFTSVGPPFIPLAIFTLLFTVPFAFINCTYTAPRDAPPVSSRLAPTARSVTPSPSKSPSEATETPNWSPFASVGPPFVPLAIFTVFALLAVPSLGSCDAWISVATAVTFNVAAPLVNTRWVIPSIC